MQLTVSVTIDLPATASIADAETSILAAGRHAMRLALHATAQSVQAHVRSCPACSAPALHADGTAQRIVLTSFGRVDLPILRKRCPHCGLRFRASSTFLAPLGPDNITPHLAHVAADAGASWPYATAARWLRDTLDAQISPESVRRCTITHGSLVAQQQHHEAERLLTPPTAEQIRAEREAEIRAPLGSTTPAPTCLLVELDGGWIGSRDAARGMEGKVSVVATGRECRGKDRSLLAPRRYAATFGSAEQIGRLTYAAAVRLNGEESRQQVVLGDGAEWIKTQVAWQFPNAVKILDWSHLERAMHKAIRAGRPGKERKAERKELYMGVGGALWEGRLDDALGLLGDIRGRDGGRHERVEEMMAYVRGQREWLGDYGAWQEAGYPIGSGAVEREVEIVLNRRMKKQGMRWKRHNADGMAALRVERINRTWDEAMEQRKLAA